VHTYNTAAVTNTGDSAANGGLSRSSSSSSGVDDGGSAASHPWGEFRKKLAAAPAVGSSATSPTNTSTSTSASQPVIHWPQLTASTTSSTTSAIGTEIGTEIGSGSGIAAEQSEAVVVEEVDDGAGDIGNEDSVAAVILVTHY